MAINIDLWRDSQGRLDGASPFGGGVTIPLSNTVASNNISLSFENVEPATSAADTTNCGANAPHRNGYPALAWDWVIAVHGGRLPYTFELLQAPTGMSFAAPEVVFNASLGVYEWTADHSRLTWANPVSGTHTVEVRVTDRDGSSITTSWPLVIGTSGHVFVDPVNGSDANDGSLGSPYQTFTPLASGHAGNICHIYSGTVAISGANYVIDGTNPTTYQAVSGEAVTIEETDGWITINTVNDVCLKGLTVNHAASGWVGGLTDRKAIVQLGDCDRTNLIDIKSTNYSTGTTASDNPAFFASMGGVNNRQFIYNWDISGAQGTVIQTFKHRGSIIRKVRCHDATFANASSSSNGGVIKLKDGWSDQTIDFCEIWENNTFANNLSCLDLAGQDQSALGISNTDVRYNKFWYTANANQGAAVRMYTHNQSPSITGTHFYRNSLKGTNDPDAWYDLFTPSTASTHENENNLLENGTLPVDAAYVNTDNQTGTTVRFDSSMNLASGTQRDTYLGTHGAEIA